MAPDAVSVWLIPLRLPEPLVCTLEAVLDGDERRRAGAMPGSRRDRFIVAHAATRIIIGQQMGTPPEELRWARGPHGKPELTGAPWQVHANLSHSGAFAALALTAHRPVGVDLQQVRPLDACRLAARFFPPAEAEYVAGGCGQAGQLVRFTRLWTRKEAYVKGVGGRLTQGMAIPVRGTAGVVDDPSGRLPGPFLVRQFVGPEGYHGAVALAGTRPYQIRQRWWRPSR